ncbi:MAG TPA: transcriptional regulator [Verrucomicrobia bacterium]|nr:transcriptional regulator [Verrucomicrobiota bacterium]HOB31587.1 TraR/DksA C4-type zinc finger protein [Verrucomicrobiota bacterium]HOP96263.1 TraR/DksA C4-type zinc finger protein [Verrucomicrobiota bacterium]HPU55879.1 TraR/DksA C4-type zinc finger protein [Verrucomicrobiota bacterium]
MTAKQSSKRTRPQTRRKAAATTDIVGSPARNARVPTKWKQHYSRLVAMREHLLRRQDGLVNDARQEQSAFSLHMADAGTDSFDRDLSLSRASSGQDAVYEIDQAINRIHNGTYGICELTGKPIEAARLEAIPWARFSVEAEKKLEKEGAVRRARLAPREAMSQGGGGETSADSREGESSEPE